MLQWHSSAAPKKSNVHPRKSQRWATEERMNDILEFVTSQAVLNGIFIGAAVKRTRDQNTFESSGSAPLVQQDLDMTSQEIRLELAHEEILIDIQDIRNEMCQLTNTVVPGNPSRKEADMIKYFATSQAPVYKPLNLVFLWTRRKDDMLVSDIIYSGQDVGKTRIFQPYKLVRPCQGIVKISGISVVFNNILPI